MKAGKILQLALFLGIFFASGTNVSYGSVVSNLLLKNLSIKNLLSEREEGDGAAYAAFLLYNSAKNEEWVRKSCYFATVAHLLGSEVLDENPEIREKTCPSLPEGVAKEVEASAKAAVARLTAR